MVENQFILRGCNNIVWHRIYLLNLLNPLYQNSSTLDLKDRICTTNTRCPTDKLLRRLLWYPGGVFLCAATDGSMGLVVEGSPRGTLDRKYRISHKKDLYLIAIVRFCLHMLHLHLYLSVIKQRILLIYNLNPSWKISSIF